MKKLLASVRKRFADAQAKALAPSNPNSPRSLEKEFRFR